MYMAGVCEHMQLCVYTGEACVCTGVGMCVYKGRCVYTGRHTCAQACVCEFVAGTLCAVSLLAVVSGKEHRAETSLPPCQGSVLPRTPLEQESLMLPHPWDPALPWSGDSRWDMGAHQGGPFLAVLTQTCDLETPVPGSTFPPSRLHPLLLWLRCEVCRRLSRQLGAAGRRSSHSSSQKAPAPFKLGL